MTVSGSDSRHHIIDGFIVTTRNCSIMCGRIRRRDPIPSIKFSPLNAKQIKQLSNDKYFDYINDLEMKMLESPSDNIIKQIKFAKQCRKQF
jgi:hypothetical protein